MKTPLQPKDDLPASLQGRLIFGNLEQIKALNPQKRKQNYTKKSKLPIKVVSSKASPLFSKRGDAMDLVAFIIANFGGREVYD